MHPSELLTLLWRRKLAVLVVMGGVLGVAAWTYSTAPVTYDSRAKVAVLPDADNPELVPFYSQAVESLLPTYAEITESLSFLEEVSEEIGASTSATTLREAVRAEPVAQLGILDIVASSKDPESAQRMAQTTAELLVERLEDNGIVSVTLLDDARIPSEPTAPSPSVVGAVAVLVGLSLGAITAVVWDRFFGRISTVAELAAVSGRSVLAAVPEMRRLPARSIIVGDLRMGPFEESLRALRTNMLFASASGGTGTTMIAGLSPADGKSTVAANLAVLVAELGQPVVLVDADLHRPVQHDFFDVPNDVGLSSLADPGLSLDRLVHRTRFENLRVLPSGPPVASRATELQVYREGIRRIESLADVVIIDGPPLEAGDEVRLLASSVQHVVLLVRSGVATQRQLRQALDSLEVVGVDLVGLVLSRSEERMDTDAYRGSRHYRRPRSSTRRERKPLEEDRPLASLTAADGDSSTRRARRRRGRRKAPTWEVAKADDVEPSGDDPVPS